MHNRIVAHNNPVMFIDPYGLCGVNIGFSMMGMDINVPVYNSNSGFFGAPILGTSTTLIGLGVQFYGDNPLNAPSHDTSNDVFVNVGAGSKFLSVSSNADLTRGAVNVGSGLGIPYVNVNTSVERFTKGLSSTILEPATKWLGKRIQNVLN